MGDDGAKGFQLCSKPLAEGDGLKPEQSRARESQCGQASGQDAKQQLALDGQIVKVSPNRHRRFGLLGALGFHHLGHAAELGANFQANLGGTFEIQAQPNAFILAGEADHPALLGELLRLTHQQRGGSA